MRITAVFLLLLCLTPALMGQNAEPGADVQVSDASDSKKDKSNDKPKLEESIVVTATRGEREVSQLPVSTTVLSEKKIESAPSITVDDLLRALPGVHLPLLGSTAHPATASRISMHGLGGTRALILLDGVPIHDPYYGTVEWQKVPLDALRQVEVVRGGSAGLFGNYSLGGTINMLTRPVEESQIRLAGAWGELDTSRQSLTVDHMLSRSLGLRVSHDRFETGGFYVLVNPGPFDFPAPSDTAVTTLRTDYEPSPTTRGSVRATRSVINVSSGLPFSISGRDILDVAGNLQRATGKTALLTTTLFSQHEDTDDSDGAVRTGGQSMYHSAQATIPTHETGGSVEWSAQRNGKISMITLGADGVVIEAKETATSFNQAGAVTSEKIIEGRQRFAGAFAQASWQPNAHLEVLTALRLDYYRNMDGSEQIVGGAGLSYPEATSTQLDPRISLRYSLGGNAVLRGAAYRAFKAPTLRDLYRSSATRALTFIGNPNLKPETLLGVEGGMEWAFARTKVALNLYRSEVDNLSARVAITPDISQAQNLGKIRSQGIELMATSSLTRNWSAEGSYTYADSTIVEDPNPSLIGNLVPDVVPHIGTLSVRYRSDRGTTVDMRGRALSRSYGEAGNITPQPAHQVFDISIAQRIRPWIDAYLIGENIFDEFYYYVTGTSTLRSTRPRTATAGVRLHFAPSRQTD